MSLLLEHHQNTLLQIARTAVERHLSGDVQVLPKIEAGILTESSALFVSIHKNSELRGCIGNLQASVPMYRVVADCAVSAAVADPRFSPLEISDLADVVFEISVLSPMERIQSVEEIQVGMHGLFVSKGQTRGLLLPQVAVQYGWDGKRFLSETCRKAGLRATDFESEVIVHRFSAQVFSEAIIHAA